MVLTNSTNEDEPKSSRLARGLPWVVGGRVVGGVAALFANMILARELSKAEYGVVIFFVGVIFAILEVAKFGLDRLVMQHLAEHAGRSSRQALKLIRRRCIGLGICSATVAVTIGSCVMFVARHKLDGMETVNFEVCTILAAIGTVFLTILILNGEGLRGLQDLKFCSMVGAQRTGPVVALSFAISVSIASVMLENLTAEITLGLFVGSIILTWVVSELAFQHTVRSYPELESTQFKPIPRVSELVGVSFVLLFMDALNCFWEQGQPFVAGFLISTDELAMFGAANQLVVLIVMPCLLGLQVVRSSIPSLYAERKREQLQKTMQVCSTYICLISLGPCLAYLLFAEPILELVYGSDYRSAAAVLRLLIVGRLGNLFAATSASVLIFTGNQRWVVWSNLISLIVMLAVAVFAAPAWGAFGFALAVVAARSLSYFLYWYGAYRLCGIWTHSSLGVLLGEQGILASIQRYCRELPGTLKRFR